MFTIVALYHFTRFENPKTIQGPLAKLCCAEGISGTLLVAHEGINGTIAGSRQGIDAVLAHIRELPGCADLVWKESQSEDQPEYETSHREVVAARLKQNTSALSVWLSAERAIHTARCRSCDSLHGASK